MICCRYTHDTCDNLRLDRSAAICSKESPEFIFSNIFRVLMRLGDIGLHRPALVYAFPSKPQKMEFSELFWQSFNE